MPTPTSLRTLVQIAAGFTVAHSIVAAGPAGQSGLQLIDGRDVVVLETPAARLEIDLAGGSIGQFRLPGTSLNPLSWSTPAAGDTSIHPFGHFLCLDRWGPPSAAEEAHGMPYHGEASHVRWSLGQQTFVPGASLDAELTAVLPLAGFSVRRVVRLSQKNAVFAVREEVTNSNPLGRIYNMVQHSTIAPPFLETSTVVDCNGRRGFAQDGKLPNPEEASKLWPEAANVQGKIVNLRELKNDPSPNVVSFAIEEKYGWITAATPAKGLLIGYLWLAKDYPWVSVWRDVQDGQPTARGLEFGTTGLHQPFPILVEKSRIWDRPLFEYLDAGETRVKRYAGFLLQIPSNFSGVQSVEFAPEQIIVHERKPMDSRTYRFPTDGLIPE